MPYTAPSCRQRPCVAPARKTSLAPTCSALPTQRFCPPCGSVQLHSLPRHARLGIQTCSTGRSVRSHASASDSSIPSEAESVSKHEHIMLALMDQRPYLSDGSKQAIAAAISYGQTSNSKVTVTLLEVDSLAGEDKKKRLETVMWHFQQSGFSNFEVLEKEAGKASVTIGDVADEIAANIVIISVEPIHAKIVDANLLAEFVPCPVLLVP